VAVLGEVYALADTDVADAGGDRDRQATLRATEETAMTRKQRPVQTFPVMDGALGAPREDQIAGIVQRVWADAQLYHGDVDPMLRQWLNLTGCTVSDDEFAALLAKAYGEFARVASQAEPGAAPQCPAHTLVACVYWDVAELERKGTPPAN
jgi:hypothetical protein